MLTRESVINKIRQLGFSFKRQADRVDIWRRGTDTISLPRRDRIDEDWVRRQFAYLGLSRDEIEQFIRTAHS